MWKKLLCVLLAYTIFIAGCGGHHANPVDRYMVGDDRKSCNALYAEVSTIDDEIAIKNRKKTDRDVWNAIFFVTGFFVIVPWFFIDPKGSYEVEIDALKARKNNLQILYAENCGTPAESVANLSAKQSSGYNTATYQDYPVTNYSYDESTGKGTLSVDISGKGIGARESVIENIGKICSDKGIALKYGEKGREGAYYRVLNESVKDGILTIDFEYAK